MASGRPFKIIAIAFGTLLLLAAVAVASLYVYVAAPHLQFSEIRVSNEPREIEVIYISYACGDFFPRLYEVAADGESEPSEQPTMLALPDGIPSPEDTELAVDGNVFRLTGYEYRGEERNVLTGSVREVPSSRFDTIAWNVSIPYEVWVSTGDSPRRQERSDPVAFSIAEGDHNPDRFTLRRYDPCL
ncbi:MAG: hypothetical protein HKM95_12970 [Inquilinus sp.]|nr:hypothetical protein [Inquilinus sp.]